MPMPKFYVSIQACRINAGLTQEELAAALDVSKNTVLNWEKGATSPSAVQLRKISELSKIPMDFIFCAENTK